MKEVQFHKNIILAPSKVHFSVKTGCIFLPDNLEGRFLPSLNIIHAFKSHKLVCEI